MSTVSCLRQVLHSHANGEGELQGRFNEAGTSGCYDRKDPLDVTEASRASRARSRLLLVDLIDFDAFPDFMCTTLVYEFPRCAILEDVSSVLIATVTTYTSRIRPSSSNIRVFVILDQRYLSLELPHKPINLSISSSDL